MLTHAIVLAGGSGTRFWPASRRALPKPFVPLLGSQTPLDATLERLGALLPAECISVVVGTDLASVARRALRAHPHVRLLVEPEPRDTAAAIAWAAAEIAGERPDARLGVFPADHYIPDAESFSATVAAASDAAAESLVLIGIAPTRPDTAYGYIRLDADPEGGVYRVASFTEKPDVDRARSFLESGSYLWNAGMVVARASRIVEECERVAPEIWEPLGDVLTRASSGKRPSPRRLADAYKAVPRISFDHAVLERSRAVVAVPGRFAWTDLGSWDALADQLPEHEGNRVVGRPPFISLDAAENLIWNPEGRAIALVGVSGLAVVSTKDALLICPQERAQDVRKVVDALREQNRDELT